MEGAILIPIPVLPAGPVVLRPFVAGDAELVRRAGADPLIPTITSVPAGATSEQAHEWIERQHRRWHDGLGWSFCIASGEVPLGQIGLWIHRVGPGRASIGYWIDRDHRRRGLVSTALRALCRWALDDVGVARLELYVEPWNEGSWRAAERVGFRREGLMRRWEPVGDGRRDMFMYSLLPTD